MEKLSIHIICILCLYSLDSHPNIISYHQQSTQIFGDANQNVFGTKSLEWEGNENDPSAKTVRLRDRLNEADTERRKAEDEADRRERAAEIAREERLAKIKYMTDMPDSTPAGTGMYIFLTPLLHWEFSSDTFSLCYCS